MSEPINVPITQFHLPDGRRTQESAPVPAQLKAKVDAILALNLEFTAEVLTTGHVSLCIVDNDLEQDYDCRVCVNGPEVIKELISMIENFDEFFRPRDRWGG